MAKISLGAKTLFYPTPAVLVGSYDKNGVPNIMTAAWAGLCCSKPASVAVSMRAATYTHGNIMARRAFTVSVPRASQVREVDYAGLASGRAGDKFAALGLTAERSALCDAPFVAECPLVLECRLAQVVEIGTHTQFVGEILDVKADADVVGADGEPDIERIQPIIYAPGRQLYYGVGAQIAKAFSVGRR